MGSAVGLNHQRGHDFKHRIGQLDVVSSHQIIVPDQFGFGNLSSPGNQRGLIQVSGGNAHIQVIGIVIYSQSHVKTKNTSPFAGWHHLNRE